jgi:type II secretory pathway component PulM
MSLPTTKQNLFPHILAKSADSQAPPDLDPISWMWYDTAARQRKKLAVLALASVMILKYSALCTVLLHAVTTASIHLKEKRRTI